MTDRSHCTVPDACLAKGPGLCRSCTGKLHMGRINADPEAVERRQFRASLAKADDAHRAAQREKLAKQRKDPRFRRAAVRAASKTMATVNGDPAIALRRGRAAAASKAAHYAARVGVPVELLAALRQLRGQKIPLDEAREILRQAHPAAFAALPPRAPSISIRALGPMPAIGTAALRAWRRKAAELRI